MEEFVQSGGNTVGGASQIYVKNNPMVIPNAVEEEPEEDKFLTPKEKMQRKKERQIQ